MCGTRIFLGKRPSHDRLKAAAEAERQPPADPRPQPKSSDADPTESVERDQGLHYRVIMQGSDRIMPVPTHLLGMDASRRSDRDQHRFSRFQPSRLSPPMGDRSVLAPCHWHIPRRRGAPPLPPPLHCSPIPGIPAMTRLDFARPTVKPGCRGGAPASTRYARPRHRLIAAVSLRNDQLRPTTTRGTVAAPVKAAARVHAKQRPFGQRRRTFRGSIVSMQGSTPSKHGLRR